jgi:hypothetical protein
LPIGIFDELYEQLERPAPKPLPICRPAFGKVVGEPSKKAQGIINAVACAREGERNSLLFWGSCRIADMIASREITNSEGANAYRALNAVCIGVGLPANEVARTIRSAVR